jgi:hypothetical protein
VSARDLKLGREPSEIVAGHDANVLFASQRLAEGAGRNSAADNLLPENLGVIAYESVSPTGMLQKLWHIPGSRVGAAIPEQAASY